VAVAVLLLDRLFSFVVVVVVILVVVFRFIGGLPDEIGGVEEGALLCANIDEGVGCLDDRLEAQRASRPPESRSAFRAEPRL